jgi:hypothetical protein
MSTPDTNPTFSCPYCGAFTSQTWSRLFAQRMSEAERTPAFPSDDFRSSILSDSKLAPSVRDSLIDWCDRVSKGAINLHRHEQSEYLSVEVENLHISSCYNCKSIAVWVHKSLCHPPLRVGPLPSQDLPDAIRVDFEEARSIIHLSPRGAAALLRLSVQKLCAHLGEKGKRIDDDIASLVKKGLNPMVQRALDAVRVVGNESVHPGEMDIRDDPATALQLLNLVNLITEQMISHPRAVNQLYGQLPAEKRKQIARRDERGDGDDLHST